MRHRNDVTYQIYSECTREWWKALSIVGAEARLPRFQVSWSTRSSRTKRYERFHFIQTSNFYIFFFFKRKAFRNLQTKCKLMTNHFSWAQMSFGPKMFSIIFEPTKNGRFGYLKCVCWMAINKIVLAKRLAIYLIPSIYRVYTLIQPRFHTQITVGMKCRVNGKLLLTPIAVSREWHDFLIL